MSYVSLIWEQIISEKIGKNSNCESLNKVCWAKVLQIRIQFIYNKTY